MQGSKFYWVEASLTFFIKKQVKKIQRPITIVRIPKDKNKTGSLKKSLKKTDMVILLICEHVQIKALLVSKV